MGADEEGTHERLKTHLLLSWLGDTMTAVNAAIIPQILEQSCYGRPMSREVANGCYGVNPAGKRVMPTLFQAIPQKPPLVSKMR
jgi:hypothetical protein